MKKYLVPVILFLIIAAGILTGCANSVKFAGANGVNVLIDCSLTKDVDSMELNMTTFMGSNEQSFTSETNVKIENIKNGMKCLETYEALGQTQERFFVISNGKLKMYMRDQSGKYSVYEGEKEQVDMEFMNSINAFIEIIENNPEIVSKIDKDTYEINIQKEETPEIYSEIIELNNSLMSFEKFLFNFVIGSDGYLKQMVYKAQSDSFNREAIIDFLNFNEKYNIVLPEVQ